MSIKRLIFLFLLFIGISPAHAQVAGMGVSGCGTPLTQLKVGIPAWLQVDTGTGSLCISGTISATTAGFNQVGFGTPLAVTNVSATSTAFTSATSVVVTNVGATNAIYCQPGAGPATTSSQYIAPAGGWFNFYAAGGMTQISCITASSTSTANFSTGTGLAAGTGGGAGGGGGTVNQGTAAGSGPWIVTPWIAGAVNSASNGLYVNLTQGNAVNSSGNPIFVQNTAGAAVMGAVTQSGGPWTVNHTQINGNAVATGANGLQQVGIVGNAGGVIDFAGQNAVTPANALQIGCSFNTTPTTVVTGHASPCQMDANANMLVKVNAALPTGSNAIGSITNTSFTNPGVGVLAAAVPASAQYIAGTNGSGNLQGISVDSSGNVNMNLVNGGVPGYNPGDTSDANGHTIYVQGAPSGNNLPVAIAAPLGLGTAAANAVAVDIISGSISAATGFNFAVTGTPLAVTNVSATSTSFTSSTEVVVTNVGASNAIYCVPGAGPATTSSQYIAPGSWFGYYAAGGITQISCITASSTSTANISAGSGLPTGSGGGGGGGGTVNQGTAAGSGPWIVTPWIAGAVNSATNGLYTNILQGNAVLSATAALPTIPSLLVGATQTQLHTDPCATQDWSYATINLNTATTTTIVTGTSSKKTYVCSLFLFVPVAVNIGIIEGTTATCGTGTAGVVGGTTAATGINLAANQGFVRDGGGHAVFATATNADNLCFAFSAAQQVSGNIIYVQQ